MVSILRVAKIIQVLRTCDLEIMKMSQQYFLLSYWNEKLYQYNPRERIDMISFASETEDPNSLEYAEEYFISL